MTENESRHGLSRQQREFVGVGASVGAGCHPCVTHHIKAGADAGLDTPALLAAITAAERVTADSSARMAQHARRQLSTTAGETTADATVRDATLAALGAAVAANSMPNIERYLSEAAELGVLPDELVDAVRVAHEVQTNAARIHARRTDTLLQALPTVSQAAAQNQADACDAACACHDEDVSSNSGVGSTTRVTGIGEAPQGVQACAEVTAGEHASPEDEPQSAPTADAQRDARAVAAGRMPPPAMLACCGGLSARAGDPHPNGPNVSPDRVG